jgi:RNA binding exosome subunit
VKKSKKKAFVASMCTVIMVILGVVIVFNYSTEEAFLPLEYRQESDEMVILANELSEKILNALHKLFPSRTFEVRTTEIEQRAGRERLRFVIHCLTTEVNFTLDESHIVSSTKTINIIRSYMDRLRSITANSWRELFNEKEQLRLEKSITRIYGESYVRIYTRGHYREEQQFSDGKTETVFPYYVSFFIVTLGRNVIDVDFIYEVSVSFPDVSTLIETVGMENLGLIRISLSYDVFLEDEFNKELEIARIRSVLYEFISEIQNHISEEMTFELFSDSRIDFIDNDGMVVERFNPGYPTELTLGELNEFDFTVFFADVN